MYTQIMQVGDLDPRPGKATPPVAEPSPGPSDALRPEPPPSPPVIHWRPDALRESPPMPSPPGPAAPRSGLGAGELDTGKRPPPIPDPVIRWQKPAPPAQGNVNPPLPATSIPTPSMPDAYNLEGGSKDLRPRVPDAEPDTSLVKPLEDPDAQAGAGELFKSAPDYVDRLRTQSSPPLPEEPPVAPPPPPLPDPGPAGPSEYTMIIQGISPSGGPRPAPQPPPTAPAPMQPQPVKRPSRAPLWIGLAVVAIVLVGLLVFFALRWGGGGGAAGTG